MADISKIQIETGTYDIKDAVARERLDNLKIDIKELDFNHSCKNYAHRGLSSEAPENTIASITKAGYHGCYGVEIDVNATRDGKLVLMHDTTVDRMTDGTGTISELDSSYIDGLVIDAGECVDEYPTQHVPYLTEALAICNRFNMCPMIELKGTWQNADFSTLLDTLYLYNITDRSTIISFDINDLIYIRSLNSNIKLAYLYNAGLTSEIVDNVANIGNCGISLNYENNTSLSVELRLRMFDNKVQFGFWTLNNKDTIHTVQTNNPGTSFIVSNYGYGGEVKPYTKKLVCYRKAGETTWRPWQTEVPSTNIGVYYDSFTISYDSEEKEYTLTYKTPFASRDPIYATIVNINFSFAYSYLYTVVARGQDNDGFKFYIVDNETGEYVANNSIHDGAKYLNISIDGY